MSTALLQPQLPGLTALQCCCWADGLGRLVVFLPCSVTWSSASLPGGRRRLGTSEMGQVRELNLSG